jgi:hypothetical protein
MKKAILFILLIIVSLHLLTAQKNQVTKNPVGSWKFESPYSPEGYKSGTIVVGLMEKKYSAAIYFTGRENKIVGEKVKVVNDSILFSVYLEDQDIKVMLKIEDASKLTGKAIYSEGELPLTLTKYTDSEVRK